MEARREVLGDLREEVSADLLEVSAEPVDPRGSSTGAGVEEEEEEEGRMVRREGREVSVDRRKEVSGDRLEEDLGARLEEAGDMVRAEEDSRRAGSTEMAVEEEGEGKRSMEEAGADLLREE